MGRKRKNKGLKKQSNKFKINETQNSNKNKQQNNTTTYENTSNKKSKNKSKKNYDPNKPKGLDNLGFSCYMNSILQCFFHIKKLREYFISKKNTFGTDKPVCIALAEIMDKLKNGKEKSFRPEKFKKIMGEKNQLFYGRKPGDAKDLFINLIDALLSELNDTNSQESSETEEIDLCKKEASFKETQNEIDEKNIINQLFCGYYETIYTCPVKNKEIYSFQNESFILFELEKIKNNLNEEGNLSLNSCFDYYNKEIPKTSFYCHLCEIIQENKCQNKIYRPPEILVIILDRGKGKIFEEQVDFKTKIDLGELTEIDEYGYKYNTSYKLIGISTHSGDSSSKGHYTAYCLNDKNEYYYFSDDYVEKIDNEKELYDDQPYLLFYQREENDNDQNNNNNEEEDMKKEDEKENSLNQIKENENDEDEDEDNYKNSEENKHNNLKNKKKDDYNPKEKNNNSNNYEDFVKIIDGLKIDEKDKNDTNKNKGRQNQTNRNKKENINSNNNINENLKDKNNNNINRLNNNKNNNLLKIRKNEKNDESTNNISIAKSKYDNKKNNNNDNKSLNNIDINKNKEIKDIENRNIRNLFRDEKKSLIENVLNLFMEKKNDKYIVDYYSSKNKNPLIWKLSLIGNKKVRHKDKEYNFIIDFSQLKFKDLTSITTTEPKTKLQLLDFAYVHTISFYNNMENYFDYISRTHLKK